MEQVRMTDAEVANDFAAVLEKLRHGAEVVVEQDHRPVAVISPVKGPGRPIDECIALAKAHGSGAKLDEEYAGDLGKIIASRRPLDTSVQHCPASGQGRR
jgi:antitoxin (DNA-binding transcriptional repressor) of toxin-antitoxin stability system